MSYDIHKRAVKKIFIVMLDDGNFLAKYSSNPIYLQKAAATKRANSWNSEKGNQNNKATVYQADITWNAT